MAFFTFYGFNPNDDGLKQIERVVKYLAQRGWIEARTTTLSAARSVRQLQKCK